jgi:hypothetical protein
LLDTLSHFSFSRASYPVLSCGRRCPQCCPTGPRGERMWENSHRGLWSRAVPISGGHASPNAARSGRVLSWP